MMTLGQIRVCEFYAILPFLALVKFGRSVSPKMMQIKNHKWDEIKCQRTAASGGSQIVIIVVVVCGLRENIVNSFPIQ